MFPTESLSVECFQFHVEEVVFDSRGHRSVRSELRSTVSHKDI